MTPQLVLGLKVGGAALLLGMVLGGGLANAWYSPLLELERTRVSSLAGLIKDQNEAIDSLKTASETQLKQSAEALEFARAARQAAEKSVDELRRRRPPVGVDQCVAAQALIAEELRR